MLKRPYEIWCTNQLLYFPQVLFFHTIAATLEEKNEALEAMTKGFYCIQFWGFEWHVEGQNAC
jgi:hypothetical protein